MTISDKIRIYELSRDLNLDNKDILDAAQKLSISEKSHSSSISLSDAKKIKNLIHAKNKGEKIISVNKPSTKLINNKQNHEERTLTNSPEKNKSVTNNINKKPILIRPINKPGNIKTVSNKLETPQKQKNSLNKPKSEVKNQGIDNKPIKSTNDLKNKIPSNFKKETNTFSKPANPSIKSPKSPPIQLIEKPKNLTNTIRGNEANKKNNSIGQRSQSYKFDQNTNSSATNNPKRIQVKNTP